MVYTHSSHITLLCSNTTDRLSSVNPVITSRLCLSEQNRSVPDVSAHLSSPQLPVRCPLQSGWSFSCWFTHLFTKTPSTVWVWTEEKLTRQTTWWCLFGDQPEEDLDVWPSTLILNRLVPSYCSMKDATESHVNVSWPFRRMSSRTLSYFVSAVLLPLPV